MKIRYVSDLHFGVNRESAVAVPFNITKMDDEHEQILILAGDVCDSCLTGIEFIRDVCSRFKHVLYVFGNHEYYKQSIDGAKDVLLRQIGSKPDNLHILDCDTFEVDDVMFVGATLWTDLNNFDPTTTHLVSRGLNDCRLIRAKQDNDVLFRGQLWTDLHCKHRDYIDIMCTSAKQQNKRVVVITHHAPSLQSVHDVFKGSDINGGFASNLDWLFEKHDILYWIHGHMHHRFEYQLYDTTVLCNPRGYRNERLQQDDGRFFDDAMLIEI